MTQGIERVIRSDSGVAHRLSLSARVLSAVVSQVKAKRQCRSASGACRIGTHMNFKACPVTPWSLFRFDRIETGLQIPDLTGFLDVNRFPPRIKSGAGFRWQTPWCMESTESCAPGTPPCSACFRAVGVGSPNKNITRVIYIHRALIEAVPVPGPRGGGAEGGSGTARSENAALPAQSSSSSSSSSLSSPA
jgi:hypothetical protein